MAFSKEDLYRRFKIAFLFRERLIGGIPKTADTELMTGWLKGQGVDEEAAIAEIAERTAQEMAEQAEEAAASTIRAGWSGFKMRGGRPVVEARQLKALLKEVANVSGDTRRYLGLKNLFQHGLYVRPKYIPLQLPEESEEEGTPAFTERVVHTFRGSSIKRADYVMRPTIEFEVGVIASNPIVTRQKIRKAGDLLFDALLLKLFLLGEEDGLGAWRTQGEGKFDLVEFERIG